MKDQEGQEVQKSLAETMADAILEGMEGKLINSTSRSGSVTYANPLYAVKLFHDSPPASSLASSCPAPPPDALVTRSPPRAARWSIAKR